MSYQVDNAIIMAAGTASRFAPLSYELPKALIEVKGEILIERQIRQLKEAGIQEIIIVVGYKKEMFSYLQEKYGVKIVENKDYLTRNNHASLYVVKEYLKNSYICSSDNYFNINPFESVVDDAYYSVVYAEGDTNEWCVTTDSQGYINQVTVGGKQSWYMLGHVFFSEKFSKKFVEILDQVYDEPSTASLLWESIYMQHLDVLKMRTRQYDSKYIFEFDTLDELRLFDDTYINDTRSDILKKLSKELGCCESDFVNLRAFKKTDNAASGFTFDLNGQRFEYTYENQIVRRI